MSNKVIKYKVMFLNHDDKKVKPLQLLMEEAQTGHILECRSEKEIRAELEALKTQGWALKVKSEVSGWGHILYMERIR